MIIYPTLVGAAAILSFFTGFFLSGYLLAYFRRAIGGKDRWAPTFSESALYGIFFTIFLIISYGIGLWIL